MKLISQKTFLSKSDSGKVGQNFLWGNARKVYELIVNNLNIEKESEINFDFYFKLELDKRSLTIDEIKKMSKEEKDLINKNLVSHARIDSNNVSLASFKN